MVSKIRSHIFSFRQERGQSIIILAFAFVGIVFMLGLALDLGLVYIERVSLKRAIDAAVLSGVVELPEEQDAGERALEYLRLNGYDLDETDVYFAGCWRNPDGTWTNHGLDVNNRPADLYWSAPTQPARNAFYIDTYSYQGDDSTDLTACNDTNEIFGVANKLKVSGRIRVDMNFMRVVPYGWQFVDVTETGTAQNIDSLDVSIVIDKSGSMEFDPVCYGCWSRATDDYTGTESDSPRYSSFYNYPENGQWFPLGYSLDTNGNGDVFEETTIQNICDHTVAAENAVYRDFSANPNHYYIIMDAEMYSRTDPVIDIEFLEGSEGYWAMQRGEGNYDDDPPFYSSNGYSIDGTTPGAHMAHHPSWSIRYGRYYSLDEARIGEAPVLEYDFRLRDGGAIDWDGEGSDGYIWVRIHRGRGMDVDRNSPKWGDETSDGRDAYWTVYPKQGGDDPANLVDPNFIPPGNTVLQVVKDNSFPADMADAADSGTWHWVRLQDTFNITPNQHYRFYFYAGSSGFSIDRIVVTNSDNSVLPANVASGNTGPTQGSGQALASVPTAACDPCNPIYAQNIGADGDPDTNYHLSDCTFFSFQVPTDNRLHPQFGEWENPMRVTKEGIKDFITFLDAERDQVGFVAYNNGNNPQFAELECAKRRGLDCAKTTNPFSYTTVLRDIELINAGGGTNIGAGMKRGLEILGIDTYDPENNSNVPTGCAGGTASCSRGASALPVMVVMTDGIPNNAPTGICRTDGPGWEGEIDVSQDGTQVAYDCPLFFADEARKNGVRVFVIGIGFGIDQSYLERIADLGGGKFFFTANGSDLDQIFAGILANIYVRLIE